MVGVVKKQIRLLFIREGTKARRDTREIENFHRACLYDLLQMSEQHEKRTAKINHLKAKLVNLFNTTRARGMIEVPPPDLTRTNRCHYSILSKGESDGSNGR